MKRAICVVAIHLAVAMPLLAESGPKEGIKVKGHWTIEVRNADGSLAKRVEIDNALVPKGSELLARLLVGNFFSARMDIRASSAAGTSPCNTGTCFLPIATRTLTAVPGGFAAVISSQMTADRAGTIDTVTGALVIGYINPPGAFEGGDFSTASLPQPVSVAAGQIIQISVAYTFL
jgi:hypothetical protein